MLFLIRSFRIVIYIFIVDNNSLQILTHISPGITRADTVFTDIRQRIVEGNILTGSKLSEPGLAKYYEISRSTLRDALSRLEGCGLLERKANIGYRVVTLSTEQLLEVFRVRESLEGMACRLAKLDAAFDTVFVCTPELSGQDTPLYGHTRERGTRISVGRADKHERVMWCVHTIRYQISNSRTVPLPHGKHFLPPGSEITLKSASSAHGSSSQRAARASRLLRGIFPPPDDSVPPPCLQT